MYIFHKKFGIQKTKTLSTSLDTLCNNNDDNDAGHNTYMIIYCPLLDDFLRVFQSAYGKQLSGQPPTAHEAF